MADLTTSESLLASTARWTAAVRARENEREDRLFADPWAAALAGQEGAAWIAGRPEGSSVPILLRTRYFDDFLMRIVGEYALKQIVLMAAGLDTRAFRLTWPEGTEVFELDQPDVLAHKAAVLEAAGASPACTRHAIAADLTEPWGDALVGAGFNPAEPSGWLLEGFLFYLPNNAVTQILDTVGGLAAPGSWLGFDIMNGITLTHPLTRPWVEMQAKAGAPWLGTMDDPVTFLADRGWAASLSQAGAPEANHGRWTLPVIPPTMPNIPHNWFVTARRIPAE